MRKPKRIQLARNTANKKVKDHFPPKIPGHYYFMGFVKGHLFRDLVTCLRYQDPSITRLYVAGCEYSSLMEDFVGFWWGPLVEPWKPDNLYSKVDFLEDKFIRATTYQGYEAYACPLCQYDEGKFVSLCSMHQQIHDLTYRIERLREMVSLDNIFGKPSREQLESRLQTQAELRRMDAEEIEYCRHEVERLQKLIGDITE